MNMKFYFRSGHFISPVGRRSGISNGKIIPWGQMHLKILMYSMFEMSTKVSNKIPRFHCLLDSFIQFSNISRAIMVSSIILRAEATAMHQTGKNICPLAYVLKVVKGN